MVQKGSVNLDGGTGNKGLREVSSGSLYYAEPYIGYDTKSTVLSRVRNVGCSGGEALDAPLRGRLPGGGTTGS